MNSTRSFLGFIVAALVLGACAPFVPVIDVSRVAPTERVASSSVRILPVGSPPSASASIGFVEATSCKLLLWDPPPSEANAIEQLKIKAHRLGADAVVDYACSDTGTDFGANCWSTVTCGGTAVKLASP